MIKAARCRAGYFDRRTILFNLIKFINLTLNQRVAGSSPAGST